MLRGMVILIVPAFLIVTVMAYRRRKGGLD